MRLHVPLRVSAGTLWPASPPAPAPRWCSTVGWGAEMLCLFIDVLRTQQPAARHSALQSRLPLPHGWPPSAAEGVLKGLDYVLDQVQQRGMKVILVFTDYFADGAGGPLQYLA